MNTFEYWFSNPVCSINNINFICACSSRHNAQLIKYSHLMSVIIIYSKNNFNFTGEFINKHSERSQNILYLISVNRARILTPYQSLLISNYIFHLSHFILISYIPCVSKVIQRFTIKFYCIWCTLSMNLIYI